MTRTPRLLVPSVRREIAGQSFEIRNCERCTILLFDATEQVRQCGGRGANEEGVRRPRRPISSAVASVQIIMEGCRHCRVLIGACESSLFVRDCRHCDLAVAVQQLRTRDCRHLRFSLYTQTRPVIETSSEVSFSCLRLAYFSQEANFEAARLSPWNNRWSEVHDFNQGAARGNERHWRFLDPAVEAAGLLLSPLDNLPDVRPKRGVRVACLCRLASLRLPPLPSPSLCGFAFVAPRSTALSAERGFADPPRAPERRISPWPRDRLLLRPRPQVQLQRPLRPGLRRLRARHHRPLLRPRPRRHQRLPRQSSTQPVTRCR